jgi:hypothetical protein
VLAMVKVVVMVMVTMMVMVISFALTAAAIKSPHVVVLELTRAVHAHIPKQQHFQVISERMYAHDRGFAYTNTSGTRTTHELLLNWCYTLCILLLIFSHTVVTRLLHTGRKKCSRHPPRTL